MVGFVWDLLKPEPCGVMNPQPQIPKALQPFKTKATNPLKFTKSLETQSPRSSGAFSGWRNLSALHWHFQSQPLPNPLGNAAHLFMPDSISPLLADLGFRIRVQSAGWAE